MIEPVYDDFTVGEAFRTTYTMRDVAYCHDVSCLRPEHPAEQEHEDNFGRRYFDGQYGHWLEEGTT